MTVGNGGKRLNGCAGIEVKRPEGYCAGVGKNGGYGDLSGGVRIEEVLEREGVLVSTTVGVSMYPMLRNRRDTVIVSPASGHLKKYDVPLYRRGGKYVLHRIVDVVDDRYVICGDNCIRREYDITDREIIGVLTGFYRVTERWQWTASGTGSMCGYGVLCILSGRYISLYAWKQGRCTVV